MGELEALSVELAGDVLRSWRRTLDRADEVYANFDDETRRWVDRNGHDFAGLVPVLALMDPQARDLSRALVEGAIDTVDRVSQGRGTVQGAVERVIAQVESGGEQMGGEGAEETDEERFARLEGWCMDLDDKLGRVVTALEAIAASAQAVARTQER